ncbi:hypothetical protein ACHAW6_000419 [Cyclotella cf. meneghiniana]
MMTCAMSHTSAALLSPTHIMTKPAIFYGNGMQAGATNDANAATNATAAAHCTTMLGDEARGNVLAHGFWSQGRGTVFDIRICDTDSRSYGATSSAKLLEHHSKEKKDKDFTPLIYSVDRMASKDMQTAEQSVAWLLAQKWKNTYSDMANFIRMWMSLAVVHSNTPLLYGNRTSPIR